MKFKKYFIALLLCATILICLSTTALAADTAQTDLPVIPQATGRFSMEVPANKLSVSSSMLPLQRDEVVTINASYTPASASVDFGLVDEDGTFYYLSGSNGSINRGMIISEAGNYYFAVRNNSNGTINVSGYVNY